jgi:phospholipase C
VVFWKPIGELNEHPGYASTLAGDRHMAEVIEKIRKSPMWKSTVIIVTYDEHGGLWDHVAPPKVDRWGPGSRVPTVIISPFAKRHTIDHTIYDTTSILTLIESRYGLSPLGTRDAKANNLARTLNLTGR